MCEKMQSPTSTAPNKFLPITFIIIIIVVIIIIIKAIRNRNIIIMTIIITINIILKTSLTLRRRISTRVMKSSCIGLVVPKDGNHHNIKFNININLCSV